MIRLVLSDAQWKRVATLLLGKPGDRGRSAADNRRFLEAVLWMPRAGAPWRDLPDQFGNRNSTIKRFRRWAQNGVFESVFKILAGDQDFEFAMIDGTIIRVHQHGTGAKGGLKIRPSGLILSLPKDARRLDDQDRRLGRRTWQSCPLRAAARTTP